MIDISALSIHTLLDIVEQAQVLRLMAERETNRIVVDYVQSRSMVAIARDEPFDEPLEVFPTSATPITFVLEDALYAGRVYVSLTCDNRILVHPFEFESYDEFLRQIDAGHFKRSRGVGR